MTSLAAEIIVDAGTRQIQGTYSYLVPPRLASTLRIGHRVYVSFGKQYLQGFVVGMDERESSQLKLKPILALLDVEPLLTTETLEVCQYLVRRYACTLLDAIHTVLPSAYKIHLKRAYRGAPDVPPSDQTLAELWTALCKQPLSFEQIVKRFSPDASLWLESLLAGGFVQEITNLVDSVGAKTQSVFEVRLRENELRDLAVGKSKRAPKQAAILNELAEKVAASDNSETRIPLRELGLIASDSAVRALLRQSGLQIVQDEVYRSPSTGHLVEPSDEGRELTRLQKTAVEAIGSLLLTPKQHEVVLHGVTGSGKTEVYLQVISQVLAVNYGAIVLVPEIVLTPQMVGRFVSRFGSNIAVLHSGLSQGERRDEWLRVRRGEAKIVIGARSAVFAPVVDLRLIIVDEEHENSYKQEETPYYDARDVAAFRAVRSDGIAVFGSATPSLDMMYEVEQGRARLLTLPVRVNEQPLPPVDIVDMREELRDGNVSIFSRSLREGLEATVAAGSQAVLFLNRRGYASFVLCRSCGEVMECPHCDISLTLHGRPGSQFLECHYCHFQAPLTQSCPHCHDPALRPFGLGTQQVEQYLAQMWPDWKVLRMDVDTTRKKGAHHAAVQQFYDGEADILLGTQMIAKGLDFPNVTFVGVIAADTMLSVPDYRAAERTFSLLTQVAGRAGRAELPGRIVIQTFRPTHYAIAAAAHHDYSEFYRQERNLREMFLYPPFCEMTVFKAVHTQENVARGAASRFERELRRRLNPETMTILPAAPDRIARIEDKFRYQVVVKYSRWDDVEKAMVDAFQTVDAKMRKLKGVCVLDVDAGRI